MAITKAAFTEDCGLFATPRGSTSPPSVERPATVVREGQVTPSTLSATWSGAFSMGRRLSEIDYFVMAITSAEAIVPQPAAAEMDEHGEQAAMAKKKRHSRAEIATKLAQANDLATRGRLQSEIARTLGVSVMTLHRWRKASHGPQAAHGVGEPNGAGGRGNRIAELQLENSRLRRLVTDLLLEKIRFEEAAKLPA